MMAEEEQMDWFPLRRIAKTLERIERKQDALDVFIRQQFAASMADVSGSAVLTGHNVPESAGDGDHPMQQFAYNDKESFKLDPIDLSACIRDLDGRQLRKSDGSTLTADDLTVSAAVSSSTPIDSSNTTDPVVDTSAYTDPKAGGSLGSGQPGTAVLDLTIGFPDGTSKVTQAGFTVGFSAPGDAVLSGSAQPEA